MMPSKRLRTSATISTRRPVSVPPLVSQRQSTSAPARLAASRVRRAKSGLARIAVEEVLGVVDHFLAVVLEVARRFRRSASGFRLRVMPSARLTCRSQLLPKMETTGVPASTSARTLRSSSTGFLAKRVEPKAVSLACCSSSSARAGEEFLVLGIGAGPAAFDVVDAELIQLLRNEQLVIHGEGDGFALRAVAESGIESEDLHGFQLSSIGWRGAGGFAGQRLAGETACPTSAAGFLRYACFFPLFQEGHHFAQLAADFFDRLVAWRLRAWRGICGGRSCSRRSTGGRIRRTGFRRESSSFRRASAALTMRGPRV